MYILNYKYLFKALLSLSVVAVIGLPINTFWHFILLVASLVSIVALPVANVTSRKALISIAILATAMILNYSLPRAAIEEGHNLFLADEVRSNILPDNLPLPIYARMKQQFDQTYPLNKRCDPHKAGCWRSPTWAESNWGQKESIKTAYAQSLDSVFRKAKYSRVVDQIEFSDLDDLRAGFVNELSNSWWGDDSDIKRTSMPYFVMYELNERIVDSLMCWTGEVLWENTQGSFDTFYNERLACKAITSADIGKRIYGLRVNPEHPLAMQLKPNAKLKFSNLARESCTLIAIIVSLILMLRWSAWRTILLPALCIATTAAFILLFVPGLTHGYTIFVGGDDGLTHEGLGREVLRHLMTGDISNALRGEEDVFYMMPGMRYFRALGFVVFGETNFGYMAMMLILPLVVFGVARLLLPRSWSFAVLALTSSLIFQFITSANYGYADPMGYVLFLIAIWLTLNPSSNLITRWLGFIVLALSVFVRPNLLIAAALLILVHFWQSTRNMSLRTAFLSSTGFGLILLVPIHNYIFGHRFVPLTSAASIPENLKAPPLTYIHAMTDVVTGHWSSANMDVIKEHLLKFRSSWEIFCIVMVLAAWTYRKRVHAPMTNGLLLVTVGMFLPFLFYSASGRYHLLAWLCAIIVGVGYIFSLHRQPIITAETRR